MPQGRDSLSLMLDIKLGECHATGLDPCQMLSAGEGCGCRRPLSGCHGYWVLCRVGAGDSSTSGTVARQVPWRGKCRMHLGQIYQPSIRPSE